jgi:hypothetical protein
VTKPTIELEPEELATAVDELTTESVTIAQWLDTLFRARQSAPTPADRADVPDS